jgi:hypothetical protein
MSSECDREMMIAIVVTSPAQTLYTEEDRSLTPGATDVPSANSGDTILNSQCRHPPLEAGTARTMNVCYTHHLPVEEPLAAHGQEYKYGVTRSSPRSYQR